MARSSSALLRRLAYTAGVLLEVDHLSHRYGDIQALRDVTTTAVPGAITALLGPNAAGKSTLLRCIIGAQKPSGGHVQLDGSPVHQIPLHRLAGQLAYVPQRSTVAAAFSVREVITLGRYALKVNPGSIDLAMEQMDIAPLADRPYAALSVGQQQRVTLARALAQLADAPHGVLILDEPMSAMDLRHVRDVTELLRSLAENGMTIIMAMHDLSLAAKVADQTWLLHEGEMVAAGTACDVLTPGRLEDVYGVGFAWIDGRLLTT
jgi:iron complex transport system ATP-binding protein